MSSNNRIEKVAIVGASGHVGRHFVEELLKTGKHTITAISRSDSKATFPDGVKIARVNYDDPETLVTALRGHDFLIISLYSQAPEGTHTTIVKAAVSAGIPYIMPNWYGADMRKEDMRREDMVSERGYRNCMEVQELGASFVAMCCGFWYEWSLALGEPTFGIDVRERTVTFFDAGTTKINTSSWGHCGRALAKLLSLPVKREGDGDQGPVLEDWKNDLFFISSFYVSQKDMLESVQRVLGTGGADWKVRYQSAEERVREGRELMMKGDRMGFAKVLYSRSFYPGAMDFEEVRVDARLGIEREELDGATKRAVDMALAGWNPFKG